MGNTVINLFDGNEAKAQVLKQCSKLSIRDDFATEAAEYAKNIVKKYGVKQSDAVESALNVAKARQSALDEKNRLHLKAVHFMGTGKK